MEYRTLAITAAEDDRDTGRFKGENPAWIECHAGSLTAASDGLDLSEVLGSVRGADEER